MGDTELYDRLGVAPDATEAEIRKAYLKLARVWHPDRNPTDEAKEKFQSLQEAHEILTQADRRKIYDDYGLEAAKEGRIPAGSGGAGANPFDFFFRGGAGGQQQQGPRKGRSAKMELGVPLEAFYNGVEKRIAVTHEKICKKCSGSGTKSGKAASRCTVCGGQGVRIVTQQSGMMIRQMQMPCDSCGGRGESVAPADLCEGCQGQKTITEKKELTLHIDKGMKDGHNFKFEGEGDEIPVPGVLPGDIIISIRQKPHAVFQRKDSNLIMEMHVPLVDALAGFETAFRHLDEAERWVKVKVEPGDVIGNDAVKVLEGQGMPIPRSSEHGHLFIRFIVDFPKTLPKHVAHKLRKLLPESNLPHPKDLVTGGALLVEPKLVEPSEQHAPRKGRDEAYHSSDDEGGQQNCKVQ